jgi:hypothetical protein
MVGVGVSDKDSLAQIGGVRGAKGCGLGTGSLAGARDVKASDAAVEPEASDVGQVGGRDSGIEIEQDAEVATAGFSEEIIEVVESAKAWGDLLRVSGIGLQRSKENSIGAERVNVVEARGDAVDAASARGVEVGGVHFVDDGALPPEIGSDAGAHPAWPSEGLGSSRGSGRGQNAGEGESEKCSTEVDHALVIVMLPET